MIVVGAPVHQRGWILPHWLDHLAGQDVDTGQLLIVLNYGRGSDNTLDVIEAERARGRFAGVELLIDEHADHSADRLWSPARYETMTRLRNDLLQRVRQLQPEWYLSCDTDMLLPPHAISTLTWECGRFAGIGPVAHMMPRGSCVNAFGAEGQRIRPPAGIEGVYAVFGVKLMRPELYQGIDYRSHPQGEDIGWASACWTAKLRLAITGHVLAKHVMTPEMLYAVDPRVGF